MFKTCQQYWIIFNDSGKYLKWLVGGIVRIVSPILDGKNVQQMDNILLKILLHVFLNEKYFVVMRTSLKFDPEGLIDNRYASASEPNHWPRYHENDYNNECSVNSLVSDGMVSCCSSVE